LRTQLIKDFCKGQGDLEIPEVESRTTKPTLVGLELWKDKRAVEYNSRLSEVTLEARAFLLKRLFESIDFKQAEHRTVWLDGLRFCINKHVKLMPGQSVNSLLTCWAESLNKQGERKQENDDVFASALSLLRGCRMLLEVPALQEVAKKILAAPIVERLQNYKSADPIDQVDILFFNGRDRDAYLKPFHDMDTLNHSYQTISYKRQSTMKPWIHPQTKRWTLERSSPRRLICLALLSNPKPSINMLSLWHFGWL